MQSIDLEMNIGEDGKIQIPAKYQTIYGKVAHVKIILKDSVTIPAGSFDPMVFSATIDWPVDGMKYQEQVRSEWK